MRRACLFLLLISELAVCLLWLGCSAQKPADVSASAQSPSPPFAASAAQAGRPESIPESVEVELTERLRKICERAGGDVGVAVTHVESGRSVALQGAAKLPLYSVFKLPLAISVLKEVEEGRLRLDQTVRVTPAEIAPGWSGNSDLWREPVERTISELIEFSIVRSDNTSSDKLLQFVGGPAAVTQRMRSLGLRNTDVRTTVREFVATRKNPNTGTASDLAELLVRLRKGDVLQPSQLTLLLGLMERATTGERRLRGALPRGTQVADKTGTGEAGSTTNDVGLITLPRDGGHLAMAVLISGSKLPAEEQEKLIAELARAAYDAYVPRDAQEKKR